MKNKKQKRYCADVNCIKTVMMLDLHNIYLFVTTMAINLSSTIVKIK